MYIKKTTEEIVMARVRRIHAVRQYLSPFLIKVYGASALFILLLSSVSVVHILSNMPSLKAPQNVFDFMVRAVLNTEFFVQIALLSLAVLVLWAIRDVQRNMKGLSFSFTLKNSG